MDLFDKRGAYNFRSFKGENGTWTIIGSESQGNGPYEEQFMDWWDTSMAMTIDTFKSDKGVITSFKRGRVYSFWLAKDIKQVEGTEVSAKAEVVKKEVKKPVTKKKR